MCRTEEEKSIIVHICSFKLQLPTALFSFFFNERRIILDNTWVHQHVITTLHYINIQKLIFIYISIKHGYYLI
jgi:hypothetical protein